MLIHSIGQTLGDSYPNTEFDWVNSKYSQSEIVPGAEYLIITVGCNDEGGQTPADMKICYLKTPVQSVIGTPRVDIDVTTSYHAVGIQYLPNTDSKYFYQFCGDSEPIDAFINTYGKSMVYRLYEALDSKSGRCTGSSRGIVLYGGFWLYSRCEKNDNRYQHRAG